MSSADFVNGLLNNGRVAFDGTILSATEVLTAVEVAAYNNRPEGETW